MSLGLLAQILVIFGLVGAAILVVRVGTTLEKVFIGLGFIGIVILMFFAH